MLLRPVHTLPQTAARRPQHAGPLVFHACVRAIAFILPHSTQVKLLGIPLRHYSLVEMQRKLN